MRVRIVTVALSAFTALIAAGSFVPAAPAPTAMAASPASASGPAAGPAAGPAEGVIVRFRPGATLSDVGEALADSDTTATASTGGSKLVFADPEPGQSVDGALADLNADPAVEFAAPDDTVAVAATPNDTYYSFQQWHYTSMNLPAAWDTTTGSASVIVAVIDTGVLTTHPDLDGKLTTGGNAGWDFYNNDSNPNDDNGHGTFVAGIVGAESNNSSYVSGVCWACKIMPVKALGPNGTGPTSAVIQGIDYAVAHGAKVINLSLGSAAANAAMLTAVDNATAAGVVVVAASGNQNTAVLYPAAYPNVIAVGATNNTGARASFSNFGPELDVMAPGEDVVSTVRLSDGTSSWGSGSGTSFASPHVAGLAGLMASNGITDVATIAAKLKSTATDLGAAGFDNLNGYGRVNAALAVDDNTPPTATITSPALGTVAGMVAFNVSASDDVAVQKVRFWVDAVYLGYDASAPYSKTWDATSFMNGKHTLKATVLDLANNETTKTVAVTLINPDTTPPAVTITAPADDATISGPSVVINADASDTQGIQKVQFWIDSTYLGYDSTAPYSLSVNSTLFANGAHVIRARVLDYGNNTSDDTASISVDNLDAVPPTVSFTSPGNDDVVLGSISIDASAADDVAVQKVQFWVDGTYLGYDATASYSKVWDSTTVTNGTHTLKIRALDTANNSSGYVTITVVVNN